MGSRGPRLLGASRIHGVHLLYGGSLTSPPTVAAPVTHAELDDMRMQRYVMCEKLNEYIDKTKEAELDAADMRSQARGFERLAENYRLAAEAYEKRAETAEQEVTRLRAEVEQARQEGYARGRAER